MHDDDRIERHRIERHRRDTDKGCRIERLRLEHFERGGDRDRAGAEPIGAVRMLVQVYDGGAMGSGPDRIYLTHPVELDGAETEGGSATPDADTTATVPVVVLGGTPNVGDVLVASGVGGRWVAERGTTSAPSGYVCGTCTIPKQDLTLSYSNLILGDGTAPLTYNNTANTWTSSCTNELIYELICLGNVPVLEVTYFVSGSCPTGQSQTASTARTAPYAITRTALACGTSFLMVTTVSNSSCPVLASYGYTGWTIST
jgi:hypothetical protein